MIENEKAFANFYKYVINKSDREEVKKMSADPGYEVLIAFLKDLAERKIPIDCLEKAKTEQEIRGYGLARDYVRIIIQFLKDQKKKRMK